MYTPPHRREEESWTINCNNVKQHVNVSYAFTNPSVQPYIYEDSFVKGNKMNGPSVNPNWGHHNNFILPDSRKLWILKH